MRFSSLLPMLLLLASPLAAQQNCSIFDLTASVVQFDSTTCEFFVVLNFQHAGTTNQFHVKGNGVNYGTYEYSQVPVTVGPFTANPLLPLVLEFLVQDAAFQDCSAQTVLTVPGCTTHTCDITNLTVDVGDCGPNLGTYTIKVNFDVSNPGNGFFELHTTGGLSLGLFPLAGLPLTLPNFPWGGGVHDVLKVCINDNPDCCETIEFLAPDCLTPGCGLSDLGVLTGDCLSDSTYKATVHFNLSSVLSLVDSFSLYLDGGLYGVFATSQLPLPVVFETNGNPHSIVEVCVSPSTGVPPCCLKKEFSIPGCFAPCAIRNFKIETDSCTSDSTFGVWLNFNVNDSTAVDSFELWGNAQSLGTYGLNQLPLHIPDFHWNGLIFNNVRVCTGNDPTCCKELQFLAPDCLPFDTCEVTNIFIKTGACTSDSTYKLTVNFNATNPGNGTFIVYTNGVLLDTFSLSEVPLVIPNFPWSGNVHDVITICIGDTSIVPGSTSPGCCKSKEFLAPDCLGACAITNLHVEVGDCDPNTNTYPLTLNFVATHPGNDSFDMYVNGQLYGTYQLNQLPLHIPNYPHSGNAVDVIKVCINDHPDCCAVTEFQTPTCSGQVCHISDLTAVVGDCNPAGGYPVTVNFAVMNPGSDFFDLYINNVIFGIFPLNQLPLVIPNFLGSGNSVDVIKICIHDQPDCCASKEIHPPNCNDCEITNLHVETGDCNPDSTYHLTVNFGVVNSTATTFVLVGNGISLGTFNISQLPLHIPNFPWDGTGPNDNLKVCMVTNNGALTCCKTIEFPIPTCLQQGACEITNLHVETGNCNQDSTYHLTVNFGVVNSNATTFVVFGNGINLGTYNISQLPLHIPNFPWDGTGPNDNLKVCLVASNGDLTCCRTLEFPIPTCLMQGACEITNLHVETGDCNPDSTYHLTVNFGVANSTATTFVVFGNGINLGTFNLSQLPLHIPNFPWDGTGPNDNLKVCLVASNGDLTCCRTLEFPIPACLHTGLCDIFDLHVETGNCTGDSTYQVTLNFGVSNAPATLFGVWANGQFLGMFGLGQLPLTIQDFPWNGGNNDVLKVCFATNVGAVTCCETIEFPVPTCLLNNTDCEIFDLVVDTGDCTSDSTYNLVLNFGVHNPLGNTFSVWANGQLFGTYTLNQLPLTIHDFPWNGGNNDVIKVCFVDPNGVTGCCKTIEFPVPACLLNSGNCEIFGMVVDPGNCTSDSTYSLFLNFQVHNQPGNVFGVWANGVFQGTFNLNQLPLNFPNFPWGGGQKDVIKVCFVTSGGTATCCRTLEFNVPDCLGTNDNCHIYDLIAVRTGCLCGQFFVALTFSHDNGGPGGFDLVGNGNNYGNFPYNTQQPIILGPFQGDGTTVYEFGAVDHNNPDCEDGFVLGKVECASPVVEPGAPSSLVISPNPAANWVNVTAILENGTDVGQATVKIYAADGRLVQTQVISNAANFQLDVSNIPAGVYRMSILAASGRLEGPFTKQ